MLSYFLAHVIFKIMASLNDMIFNCGSLSWFKVGRFYLIYFGKNSNYLYAFIHKQDKVNSSWCLTICQKMARKCIQQDFRD